MAKPEIPVDRFGEFEAGLSKALQMANGNGGKTIVVIGRTGSGKSVLARAFAEKHKEMVFIELDRQKLFADGRKQFLELADRLQPCIIDEPRFYDNLRDFINSDGAPVVLLLQDKQDGQLIGIDLSESYEITVVDYRTWCEIAGEPCK